MRHAWLAGAAGVAVVVACGLHLVSADGPTPISVSALPAVSMPGMTITIKGSTGIDTVGAPQVKLVITPPSDGGKAAAPINLTIPPSKDGDFSTTFSQTKAIGKYSIKVVTPGGKGEATTSFTIAPPPAAFKEYDGEIQALIPVAEKGIGRAKDILAELPESPDKAEAQKKLDAIRDKLKEIGPAASVARLTRPLQDQVTRVPDEGARLAPLFEALGQWEGQSREERVRINEELIKSANEGEQCEKMDQAIEAISLASAIINFIAAPFTILQNFAQDVIGAKAADWGAGDAGGLGLKAAASLMNVEIRKVQLLVGPAEMRFGYRQFAVSGRGYEFTHFKSTSEWQTATKTTLGAAELEKTALGMVFDVVNLFAEGYYGKFCERIEGPLQGRMDGEVKTAGRTYWKFGIGLKGKLVLRHAKTDPNTAIRVRGQLMGFGTDFSVYEDIVGSLFGDTVRDNKAITWHKVTTPQINIGLDVWNALLESQGAVAQTLGSPTSFYIPVEGDIVKNTLTLRIKNARFDFNEDSTAARALYFFIGPRGSEFINQQLPYKNAQFIIARAMSAEVSNTADLQVTVDSKGKSTLVSGDFKRDFENKEGGATATYTLHVKACNPGCRP